MLPSSGRLQPHSSHRSPISSQESQMSVLRRRSSSPAAAPPLEGEDLLAEILLRLPPEPSSLPRASAVCKRWRHLVSDPRFTRRFRRHHGHNPPILGFFKTFFRISFQPTLEAPNRVAPGRFSLQQQDHGDRLRSLGCRPRRYPITGDQHRIPVPPQFDVGNIMSNGAVLRAAGDVHFQVVLVSAGIDDEQHARVFGYVYSSETGLWGNLVTPPLSLMDVLYDRPAVLVGDSLYWTLIGDSPGILEFDLERQCLDVIRLPMHVFKEEHGLTVMPAEGGGLGFLSVSEEDLSAQLWKRKTDCDGVLTWEVARTIELDKLLSLNSLEERKTLMIVGYAECNNAVFLWTRIGLFMVHLESFQFKKVLQDDSFECCQPFESVYSAGT